VQDRQGFLGSARAMAESIFQFRAHLSEGELVGDFSLEDQHGNTVTLDDLVATGPLVLFFYQRTMTPG